MLCRLRQLLLVNLLMLNDIRILFLWNLLFFPVALPVLLEFFFLGFLFYKSFFYGFYLFRLLLFRLLLFRFSLYRFFLYGFFLYGFFLHFGRIHLLIRVYCLNGILKLWRSICRIRHVHRQKQFVKDAVYPVIGLRVILTCASRLSQNFQVIDKILHGICRCFISPLCV